VTFSGVGGGGRHAGEISPDEMDIASAWDSTDIKSPFCVADASLCKLQDALSWKCRAATRRGPVLDKKKTNKRKKKKKKNAYRSAMLRSNVEARYRSDS